MTREEAINKIRQMRLPKETMEILEALAPELSGSEGERILASIADCVGLMGEDGNVFSNHNVTKAQVLAYLEKQKDQKPAIKLVFPKFRVGDIIRNVHDESDKTTRRISYVGEHGYNFDYRHLGDKAGGGSFGFCYEDYYELVEQKPAEWSEKDKKTIDDAYCWLCEYAGSLIQKNYGKSSMLYGIADKLKSLRPSWKPSDEQMKAMSYFVRKHQATANRATTKWPEFEAFKSLYNDLKKRM